MRRRWFFPSVIALAALLVLAVGLTQAQSPTPRGQNGAAVSQGPSSTAITYQGQLERQGQPVNDTCDMEFRLYDDADTGSQVGSTLTLTVAISDGLFTAALDFGYNAFTGAGRWLDIAVQCPGDADFIPLSPRQALTAAPYALSLYPGAIISGTVAGGSSLIVHNDDIYGTSYGVHSTGLIGLHGYGLDNGFGGGTGVEGECGGGSCFGVVGRGGMDGGTGVSGSGYYGVTGVGSSTGSTSRGVYGQSSSTTGAGVYGYADAGTGENYGVYGRTDSIHGRGVYGYASPETGDGQGVRGVSASSTNGVGVYGYGTATSGESYGVFGRSASYDGYGIYGTGPGHGVYGWATSSTGENYGVYGQTDSIHGRGVYGYASPETGDGQGVRGVSASSTNGVGVYGYGTATSGENYGVFGRSASYDGYGIYGTGPGYGVYGRATSSTGLAYGVYGEAVSPGGTGVYGIAPAGGVFGYANGASGFTVGVYGQTASPGGWAGYFVTSGAGNGVHIATTAGAVGLEVIGGSKNAVVGTADGARLLYSEESTEVWFADYGFGRLQDGAAVVTIDPIYAQTVNLEEPYHVFVQVYGEAEVYVGGRSPTQFEVHLREGDAQVEFSYRIVALRLGFEGQRLERAPWADDDPHLYPEQAVDLPGGAQ